MTVAAVPRRARHGERGQSTVEFALVLPLLLLVVLAAAQVGLVVLAKLSVVHTAREVARALSVEPGADADIVAAAARPTGGPVDVRVQWKPAPVADRRIVVVTVRQQVPAMFGALLPAVDVSATAAMLAEQEP